MNLTTLSLPPLGSVKDQAVTVAQDTMKTAHATLVLVSVGVIATIQDSVNGLLHDRG
jgi:hypothetical protein